ncbi:hypothetical protein JKP88DRAFT_290888 [Tribonema minus]|uniref:Uncharacterized protein n=1 Tax=Tribonema minus TaxID=303371 RepID=A0A835YSR5_9STRA|nr:hypothetical protein JKP88DRAFT_290888 [Tribonema minus]
MECGNAHPQSAAATALSLDAAALVREVLRRCCARRAAAAPLDPSLPALNLIVAVCGRFFAQAQQSELE